MDEKLEPATEDHSSAHTSNANKLSSSGLTLVLPALSALKQQNGSKKSKSKSTLPQSLLEGTGEVKKIPRPVKLKPLKEVLSKLIAQIKKKDDYAFFLSPVDVTQVLGYSDVIKHPMDFGTMTTKVARGRYRSLEDFTSDLRLVTGNAKLFNPPDSIYYTEADRIETWSLDHIAKAALTVIEYETDWNIDVERDFDDRPDRDNAHIDEDRHQSGTPIDIDDHAPSISSAHGRLSTASGRRATRGPYQKKVPNTNTNTISESIDAEGRLPGSRDGLGAFPPGSDLAKLMLALKIKGKRYRTKKERMRIEKGGPPYRVDGSLNYAEVEDPFSVFSVFVPDTHSPLHLTPLYPFKEPADTPLHSPVTLPFPDARPLPELRAASTTTNPPGKRYHWTITRNAPARTKLKDRDDDDSSSISWENWREVQVVDWGALAVLEGVLREEMDKRGYGVERIEQEKLFDVIRESVESEKDAAPDDTPEYFSLARAEEAEAYVRDVVYSGVDGFAYVRSLAEFVADRPNDGRTSALGIPLVEWVDKILVNPLTGARHSLLRDTTQFFFPPPSTDTSSSHYDTIRQQVSLSLDVYPTVAKNLRSLRQIETHQVDMGTLIRDPEELFGSEKAWAGREWKRRRVERLKAEGADIDEGRVKSEEESEKDEGGMSYEGTDMLSHVLDYSAGVIEALDRGIRSRSPAGLEERHTEDLARQDTSSLKRKFEEVEEGVTWDDHPVPEQAPEDPLLQDLRLNLLALAKRAPLDKIARLPADLVPEHIRHYVPTLEKGA